MWITSQIQSALLKASQVETACTQRCPLTLLLDCPGQRVNKPEGHYRNSEQTGRHPAPPYRLDQLRDLPGPQRSLKMPPLRPLPSLVPNYNLIALPVQPFSGNNINGTTVADLEFPILTQRDPDAAFHAAGHGPPNMWTSSDFVARAGGLEKDDDIEDEAQSIYAPSVSVVGSQMMNPAAFRHARAPSVMSDMSFVPGSPVATVERIARRQRVFEPASTPTPSQPFGSQPMSQSQSRNQMPPPATPSRFGALQQPPPAFGGVQVRAVRRQHAGLDDELPNPTRTERGAAPLTVRPVQYRLQPRLVQHVLDYIGDKLSKNHVVSTVYTNNGGESDPHKVPEMQPKNGSEPQPLAGPAGPQPIVIDDADVFGPPVRLDKGKRKASPQDESQPPSILGTTSRGASTSAPGSRSPTANPGPPPAKVRRLTRIQTIREERAGKAQEEAEADFVAGLYAYRKTGRWNGFESLAVRAAAREVVDSLKGGQ